MTNYATSNLLFPSVIGCCDVSWEETQINKRRIKERGIAFASAFDLTNLNRSGTRFIAKWIRNKQLILNIILSLVKTVPHCLLTLFVYTINYSSCAVLICHTKMYSNWLYHCRTKFYIYNLGTDEIQNFHRCRHKLVSPM